MAGVMVAAAWCRRCCCRASAHAPNAAAAADPPRPDRLLRRCCRWRWAWCSPLTDRAAADAAGAPRWRQRAARRPSWIDLLALLAGMALDDAAGRPGLGGAGRASDAAVGPARTTLRSPAPRPFLAFHRALQARRRLRRLAADALPAEGMAYAPAEVGVVNKVIGLWLTIGGALVGGALMLRRPVALAVALRLLQMASNLGFWWLAVNGAGRAARPHDSGLRLGLRQLAAATPVDGGLLMVIAFEPLRRHGHGGLRGLPDEPVQPALHRHAVRAAVGVFLGGRVGGAAGRRAGRDDRLAAVLPSLSTAGAVPALWMLWWLRGPVRALEVDRKPHARPTIEIGASAPRAMNDCFRTDADIPTSLPRSSTARLPLRVGGANRRALFTARLLAALALFQRWRARASRWARARASPSWCRLTGGERGANQQLRQMSSRSQNALAPDNHPQVIRLRAIAQRIIPSRRLEPRARAGAGRST